jgi:predicted nucleotidyltransferase
VDKRKIKSIVKNFIKALKKHNIKIEIVILYGSCAKGTADIDSDIDVAVISPDFGKDKFEEAILLKKISEEVYLGISPEPYSIEEYKQASQNEFLYQEIIKKGKIITV